MISVRCGSSAKKGVKLMAKRTETLELEKALMAKTVEFRTFGCPEVTIGWFGRKRVDFMQTNTKGIIWCYEIKVSVSDFHSKHGHNFEGHYNYYVMTPELYKEVKDEIPDGVGVLVGKFLDCKKKAKRKKLTAEQADAMRLYLIRSLSREVKKNYKAHDGDTINEYERRIAYWKRLYEFEREKKWKNSPRR